MKVLPDRFIISQWRECIAIKRQWEKGTLKHRLVSYVMEHHKDIFYQYVEMLIWEMDRRGINYQKKFVREFKNFSKEDVNGLAVSIRYPEHNNRYLKQCYYNLQEKYDRGIITKEEWKLIHKNIYGLIEEEK